MFILFLSFCFICSTNIAPGPSVLLRNAAQPGVRMPVTGLGTGTYGEPDGTYGEYWTDEIAETATLSWLKLGGRRIDGSYGYPGQAGVGTGIKKSNISREEIFITSKVSPKGYKNTMVELAGILESLQTDYVDLLLIHFPGTWNDLSGFQCAHVNGTINFRPCREDTWKALEDIFRAKKARAIGVSSYEVSHLEEIIELNTSLPAVNQVEFHLYWHEDLIVDFCQKHNILFNSFAPLGAPDFVAYLPKDRFGVPLMNVPLVGELAKKYMKSPAQVLLRWAVQQDIVVNPRTENPAHMMENLDLFSFSLTDTELAQLSFMQRPSYKVNDDARIIPGG